MSRRPEDAPRHRRRRRILAILLFSAAALGGVIATALITGFGDTGGGDITAAAPLPPPPAPSTRAPANPTTSTRAPSSRLPFTIAGSGRRDLHPGGTLVRVDLVFTNPNAAAITVTSVTVRLTGTSASGCSAANFRVAQQLTLTVTVPPRSTASLSGLGVPRSAWPRLRMLDTGNQDACKRAAVRLAFTGTEKG